MKKRNANPLRQMAFVLLGLSSLTMMAACSAATKATTPVVRPKTTGSTADGFSPQLQSITKVNNSNSIASSGNNSDNFGAVPTTDQYVLDFTINDSGRSVSFETVQGSSDIGSDITTYSGRYDYILDSQCIDSACSQIMVMLSETDETTNLSYQAVYFAMDSGNGFQVIKSTMGTSYDSITDAIAATVDGPPAS